ncbi:MAG TPA: SH3 domain-containing protein [Candidatus Ozemobacteraceae bacterium]|nr:SH3 domain-containing protein [Candidatus Ozemobacteraceae bacterium]
MTLPTRSTLLPADLFRRLALLFTLFGLIPLISHRGNAATNFKPAKLRPLQQAHLDPTLQQFWKQMALATRTRNFAFLEPHIDPNLRWTLGPESGIKSFMRYWNLDKNPQQSIFWKELDRVLHLGGAFINNDRNRFQAPYVSACWPDEYDGFTHAAIIADNVPLRQTPEPAGKVIGWLSYDIVRLDIDQLSHAPRQKLQGETHPWVQVTTAQGHTGFVWGKYVRSPIDIRLMVEKIDGIWKITCFLAGD